MFELIIATYLKKKITKNWKFSLNIIYCIKSLGQSKVLQIFCYVLICGTYIVSKAVQAIMLPAVVHSIVVHIAIFFFTHFSDINNTIGKPLFCNE